MLPGLQELLQQTPKKDRQGWIVNPEPLEFQFTADKEWNRPPDDVLKRLVNRYSNSAMANAFGVSECAIRKWLLASRITRQGKRKHGVIPTEEIPQLPAATHQRSVERLTKERVSRVISKIGEKAAIVVRQEDERTKVRKKFASSHDLRRGCALRLIDAGVSAETLMVVMRHADFATTQKFYGAMRSAQSAAAEVREKLSACKKTELVGGLVGGTDQPTQLNEAEVRKLKALLASL